MKVTHMATANFSSPGPATISILRQGNFTALGGEAVGFSQRDLAELVSSYDPHSDPAPVVIGHPKTDDPAWGWVSGLKMDAGSVNATIDRLAPAFVEAVREGRYRKVSVSLFPPKAAANPKPGKWYLSV